MTVYGNPSRVSVETIGGGIAGVSGGEEQKVVLFARGDPTNGNASANDPTQVSGQGSLGSEFGAGTPITEYFRQVAENGIAYSQIWGVMPETTSVSDESANATSSYELGNAPIIEDVSEITIQNSNGDDVAVEFKHGNPPSSPSAGDTAFVNANSGEVEFDSSDDYTISYKYLDWQSAFDAATTVVQEQELGAWLIGSEADEVVDAAQSTKEPLRTDQWKMVNVLGMAEPNQTGSDDGAEIDVANYSTAIDDDATFLFGPGRIDASSISVLGAIGGIAAGNAIDNPIIAEELAGVDELEQTLNVAKQEALEGEGVIPLSNAGTPSIEGNVSTSTETDWRRTYFSRRLSDRLILVARAVAKATRGDLNNDNTETIVEQEIADEIEDLITDGVLRPNSGTDQRWFVNAEQDPENPKELDVSFGFTPTGVVDIVDVSQTINY